jgi:predicted phosphodiesterase
MTSAPLRTVGILGDIHQEDGLLALALAHFARLRLDAILSPGDLCDGPGDFSRCCRLLQEAGALCARGNHERWLLNHAMRDLPEAIPPAAVTEEERTFLASLPVTRRLETVRGPLFLCHGVGEDDMAMFGPNDFGYALDTNGPLQALLATRGEARPRFVVCGHTHRWMFRSLQGVTFLNAGTFLGDEPRVAVADFERGFVQFEDLLEDGRVVEADRFELPG